MLTPARSLRSATTAISSTVSPRKSSPSTARAMRNSTAATTPSITTGKRHSDFLNQHQRVISRQRARASRLKKRLPRSSNVKRHARLRRRTARARKRKRKPHVAHRLSKLRLPKLKSASPLFLKRWDAPKLCGRPNVSRSLTKNTGRPTNFCAHSTRSGSVSRLKQRTLERQCRRCAHLSHAAKVQPLMASFPRSFFYRLVSESSTMSPLSRQGRERPQRRARRYRRFLE